MAKVGRAVAVAILAFVTYIVFSGSLTAYDVVTGLVIAVFCGAIFSSIVVTSATKIADPRRWYYLVKYALRYFIIDETLAHIDVIRRILHPKVPVNPAVVRVPFYVETDYAKTAIANSITNTPGTVVLEIDESENVFYVHWIDAKTLEPEEARNTISRVFEEYSKKVFD